LKNCPTFAKKAFPARASFPSSSSSSTGQTPQSEAQAPPLLFIELSAAQVSPSLQTPSPQIPQPLQEIPSDEIQTTEDGTKCLVHPDNILSGGPRKGGLEQIEGFPH